MVMGQSLSWLRVANLDSRVAQFSVEAEFLPLNHCNKSFQSKLPVYTTATWLLFGRDSDQNLKCTETTPRWETWFVTMWNK